MEIITGLDFVQKVNELDDRIRILDPDDEGRLGVILPDGSTYRSHGDYDYIYRNLVKLNEREKGNSL